MIVKECAEKPSFSGERASVSENGEEQRQKRRSAVVREG